MSVKYDPHLSYKIINFFQVEVNDRNIVQKAIEILKNQNDSKIEITSLRKGKSGRNLYQISFDAKKYVVHAGDCDLTSFASLTKLAADHEFGPSLIFHNVECRALITDFVVGKHLIPKDLENIEVVRQLVSGLKQLHQSTFQLRPYDKLETTKTNLKNIGDPFKIIDHFNSITFAIAQRNFPKVPCHNDIHPGNLLYSSEGRVQMIDWDDAGMSDPFYDLARVSIEFCFNSEQNAFLLRHYFGEPNKVEFTRFYLMRQLYLASIATDFLLAQDKPLDEMIQKRLYLLVQNKVILDQGNPLAFFKEAAPNFFNTFLENIRSQKYADSMKILSETDLIHPPLTIHFS